MRLGDFHQMVSTELKRGNSLDGVIPSKVRHAVRFLERNYAFKYMETWVDLGLDSMDQLVQFPWSFRSFRWLRYVGASSTEQVYLRSVDGRELFSDTPDPFPTTYTQLGFEAIRFNKPTYQALQMEGVVYRFSDWQTTVSNYSHFLLTNAEDLLLYQTLMLMAIYLKDPRMVASYKPMRDEALTAMYAMDQDAEENGKNEQMVYGGDFGR